MIEDLLKEIDPSDTLTGLCSLGENSWGYKPNLARIRDIWVRMGCVTEVEADKALLTVSWESLQLRSLLLAISKASTIEGGSGLDEVSATEMLKAVFDTKAGKNLVQRSLNDTETGSFRSNGIEGHS